MKHFSVEIPFAISPRPHLYTSLFVCLPFSGASSPLVAPVDNEILMMNSMYKERFPKAKIELESRLQVSITWWDLTVPSDVRVPTTTETLRNKRPHSTDGCFLNFMLNLRLPRRFLQFLQRGYRRYVPRCGNRVKFGILTIRKFVHFL